MNLKEKITLANKEASLYHAQGMYEEALQKYREVLTLLDAFKSLKNKDDLKKKINLKIHEVEEKIDFYENGNSSRQLSEKKKDLIKKLFTSKNDPDFQKFQEALTLAKFGQFQEAINEMTPFLGDEKNRIEAARNIIKCYVELGNEEKINSIISEWIERDVINTEEAGSIYGGEISFEDDNIEAVEKNDFKPKTSAAPEILEINSVGIKLSESPEEYGDQVEFDVSFQAGNHLSLIISSKEKSIIDKLDVGLKLNDMNFYSPIAVFKSSGIVLSKHQIKMGPKKGDWCLDIEIKNPT